MKIVICEDNVVAKEILFNLLDKPTNKLFLAKDGLAGLEIIKNELPDIVLLDIIMPKMDGFTVLQELQKLGLTDKIPIILTTAITDAQAIQKGMELGAFDFVKKPINHIELLARINSALRYKNQKDKEIHQEKIKSLTELIYGLADSLNNKINALQLSVDLFLTKENNSNLKKNSNILSIINISNEISSLVHELQKSFQYSESKAYKGNLIKIIEKIIKKNAQRKPITIEINTNDIPPIMQSFSFETTIDKILENAYEASQNKYSDIRIKIDHKDDQYVYLHISDQGSGIKQDILANVFTPFFTTKGTNKFGLGLWFAYYDLHSLGGDITISANRPKGTTVILKIPIWQ